MPSDSAASPSASSSPSPNLRSAGLKLDQTLAALGSPIRVQMLRIIARGQPVSVKTIARTLGRKPNAVGQHLRILERAGVIVATRSEGGDGRAANYLLPAPLRDQPAPDHELDLGCCVLRWPE